MGNNFFLYPCFELSLHCKRQKQLKGKYEIIVGISNMNDDFSYFGGSKKNIN